MLGLGDGDLLVHEIAVLGEYVDDKEVKQILPFSYLSDILDNRIEQILAAANCESARWFLTGKGNFRYDIAAVKPYKAKRGAKPFHYENLKWYLISRYKAEVVDGMEADDAMAIAQTQALEANRCWSLTPPYLLEENAQTVILTRDKDLLQVPGWHYGWEVGKQAEQRLHFVQPLGELNATYEESISSKTGKQLRSFGKLSGTGYMWFCAQILTGDTTDDIPGCKGIGSGKAYEILQNCEDARGCIKAVKSAFQRVYMEDGDSMLLEQARLVWMVRQVDDEGKPIMLELEDFQ